MANGVRVVGGSTSPPDRGRRTGGRGDGGDGGDAEGMDDGVGQRDERGDERIDDVGDAGAAVPRAVPGAVAGAPDDQPAAHDHRPAAQEARSAAQGRRRARVREGGERSPRRRRAGVAALAVLAVLGVAGTIGFGLAWDGLHATQSEEAQARAAARSFLVDLTNFNAKTVDADFSAVSSMATGPFATQAQKFFNSTIRQELQKALASSRGQIRALYIQSYGGGAATVYAVVDQLYVNDKLTSPQTDVLRVVVSLSQVSGRWKVGNVTVLQGPQLGSSTGSSGSGTSGTTTPSPSTTTTGTTSAPTGAGG